jgi:nucleotide-binding universal stress UspA family protein
VTVLVGLPRDERAPAAIHLGVMLARSLDQDLLVCTVVPPPWPPGMGRIDAEYQEYLDRSAQEAIEQARGLVPADRAADFVVARARSTSTGLLEVARERGARLLALGSSTAGVLGRVAFGSVADRLLHTSPLPLVLGPRGFRCRPDATVRRVTAAFGATESADELVIAVAGVAARAGAALRVASFAVRPRTPLTAGIGSRAEDAVAREWAADAKGAQRAVLEQVEKLPRRPSAVEPVVGHGSDWAGAIEDIGWDDGDLFAVGSSPAGPLEHVFIGSRSSRIVRHSPVPVVVVPRGAARALAERAEQG